jgi:hypothetical protein
MRHSRLRPFAALAGSLVTTAAFACPDCPTARVVKASILGGDSWNHLVMVTVPFLLIGSLSALLYRVGLSRDEPEAGP